MIHGRSVRVGGLKGSKGGQTLGEGGGGESSLESFCNLSLGFEMH